MTSPAVTQRLDELAADIGRLRRRTEPGSSLEHLADRMAGHVEILYLNEQPTAGELANTTAPGDPAAVDAALVTADAWWNRLQARLGKPAA